MFLAAWLPLAACGRAERETLGAGGDPSHGNHQVNSQYQKHVHFVHVDDGQQWWGDIEPYSGELSTPEGQLSWLP